MINNNELLREIKCLPEIKEFDLILFLLTKFKSVGSLADIAPKITFALDVSAYKEAIDEIDSLHLAKYDSWRILACNTPLTLIGKLEFIFYQGSLVQGGIQLIFEQQLYESFAQIYDYIENLIEKQYLVEKPLLGMSLFNDRMLSFYDIPPDTPKHKVDFLRRIFAMTESEQRIEVLRYASKYATRGELITPENLSLHNTIQGYMSLASPALGKTASLNLRMVDNLWCNLAYA